MGPLKDSKDFDFFSVLFQTVIHFGAYRTISSQKFTLIPSISSDLSITNYRMKKKQRKIFTN